MNTALWVAQTVLAALYVMAGLHKVTGQGSMLEKMMPGMSLALVRVIGVGEALAGFALVLPAAARGWAAVAGWAGAILAAEAGVVVVYHLLDRAYVPTGGPVVLGLPAAFLASGGVPLEEPGHRG